MLSLHRAAGCLAAEVADRLDDLANLLGRLNSGRAPSVGEAIEAARVVRERLDSRWVGGWLVDLAKSLRSEEEAEDG